MTTIQPMLATTLGRPPRKFADFAVEAKYDGQRGIAILQNGSVILLSRNGADLGAISRVDTNRRAAGPDHAAEAVPLEFDRTLGAGRRHTECREHRIGH